MNEDIKKRLQEHINTRTSEVLNNKSKSKDTKTILKNKLKSREKIYDRCISEGDVCVEVGVRLGENAAAIYLRNPKKLYLVDKWSLTHHSRNRKFIKVVKALFEEIKNVIIMEVWSKEAALKFEKRSIDFIYIDAGHTYKDVKKDINNWFPKVKVGGFIAGDDYVNKKYPERGVKWERLQYGVVEAVDELIATGKVEILYFDENKTFPLPGSGQFALKKIEHFEGKVLGDANTKKKKKKRSKHLTGIT